MFKLVILFNLLIFGNDSLTKSESQFQGIWLDVRYWCHTFMCSGSTNSGSKSELTEKVDDQHHGTSKARLEWFGFCQLKTNPVTPPWYRLQSWGTLTLEGWFPCRVELNPNKTQLDQLIKVFRIQLGLIFRAGAKLCMRVALQDQRSPPLPQWGMGTEEIYIFKYILIRPIGLIF